MTFFPCEFYSQGGVFVWDSTDLWKSLGSWTGPVSSAAASDFCRREKQQQRTGEPSGVVVGGAAQAHG